LVVVKWLVLFVVFLLGGWWVVAAFLVCLQNPPQPISNLEQTQTPKHSRQLNPLVVVVHRGFLATTTIEK
jgi:hypothetical protein